MTTTEVKAELNRVRTAERAYRFAKEKALAYSQLLVSCRTVRYESDGSIHERDGNAVERAYCRAAEYDAEADRLLDEYNAARKQAEKLISSLAEPTQREVLSRRYLMGQKWEEIAKSMYYSRQHVLRLHGYALQSMCLNVTVSVWYYYDSKEIKSTAASVPLSARRALLYSYCHNALRKMSNMDNFTIF